MSGGAPRGRGVKAQELDANGCLTKPVELDELLTIVARFVRPEDGEAPRV